MFRNHKTAYIVLILLATALFVEITSQDGGFDVNQDGLIGWPDIGLAVSFVVAKPLAVFMQIIENTFGVNFYKWRMSVENWLFWGGLFWLFLWFLLSRMFRWYSKRQRR